MPVFCNANVGGGGTSVSPCTHLLQGTVVGVVGGGGGRKKKDNTNRALQTRTPKELRKTFLRSVSFRLLLLAPRRGS